MTTFSKPFRKIIVNASMQILLIHFVISFVCENTLPRFHAVVRLD